MKLFGMVWGQEASGGLEYLGLLALLFESFFSTAKYARIRNIALDNGISCSHVPVYETGAYCFLIIGVIPRKEDVGDAEDDESI